MLQALLAVLALLTPCAGASASPLSWSSAVIGNIAFQLVDLDPDDGVAPSIGLSTWTRIGANIANVPELGFDLHASILSPDASPRFSMWNSNALAYTAGYIDGMTLSADGWLDGVSGYYGNVQQSNQFTLSANTLLVVTGHAKASASSRLSTSDMASGDVSFQIIDSQNALPFQQLAFYNAHAYNYGNAPLERDEDFTLHFFNRNDTVLKGTIDIYAAAYGMMRQAPTPVPEPASPWVVTAGVGVMALSLRRRRIR